ncbi:MAG: hypothetical protein D3903_06795, partial [Candidatus Electrothrix sp. GM3_4]|nr:hypothetical protein [Candidatus Electrothrix sp. GM3_4]
MFVLDNSGSMDWSFMTPESSGQFQRKSYLWGMGDNAYSSYSSNGKVSNKLEWQGQWAGYNRIFYNPHSSYIPWPRWNKTNSTEGLFGTKIVSGGIIPPLEADLEMPRSNPLFKSPTLDLHANYVSIKNVNVVNAHYYMVHDKNGDGTHRDDDEKIQRDDEVYLVNIVWTDSDSDSNVEEGEVLRHYHLVSYDNDSGNHEDVTSLKEVNYNPTNPGSDEVPDAIQPRTYDDNGNPDGFVSDLDDLQNFANWFSFYRRRELTAKAGVSRTIVDLDTVYVGYNTMWRDNSDGGAKQPVLPIRVYQTIETGANDIVVDNKGSGFSEGGEFTYEKWNKRKKKWVTRTANSWEEANRNNEYKSSARRTLDHPDNNNAWTKFTPTITEAGSYDVSGWWPCADDYDQKVKITVYNKDGTDIKLYNQRARRTDSVTEGDCTDTDASSGCCGYWIPLGQYYFDKGTEGYVEIRRHSGSTGDHTAADAVRFQMKGVLDTKKVDQTNELLDVLYRISSSGGTPLRQTLKEVGQYYHMDDSSSGGIGDCPYLSADEGGACQHAYAIAMTDGFWNGSSPNLNPANQDGGKGAPYEDDHDNTLADVAMFYYDTDLAASLPNNYDKKKTQHMVTFSVSFGMDGTIKTDDINGDDKADNPGYADDPYFLLTEEHEKNKTFPIWPKPVQDESSTIDDLWHTSVNGRGRYFSAKDPDTLVSSLKDT